MSFGRQGYDGQGGSPGNPGGYGQIPGDQRPGGATPGYGINDPNDNGVFRSPTANPAPYGQGGSGNEGGDVNNASNPFQPRPPQPIVPGDGGGSVGPDGEDIPNKYSVAPTNGDQNPTQTGGAEASGGMATAGNKQRQNAFQTGGGRRGGF